METLPQRSLNKTPLRKKLQQSEQVMVDAMKAIENGMPVAIADTEHNVLTSTLQDRMSEDVVHDIRPGPGPYLTHDEEKLLAEYITKCSSAGRSKTLAEIMTIAENAVHDKFNNKRITHSWLFRFERKQHDLLLSKEDPSNVHEGFGSAINPTTSKSLKPNQPSEKSQVVLKYDSVIGVLHS